MFELRRLLLPVLLLTATDLQAIEPQFIPLPDLDGPTVVRGLSTNGQVAVGGSGGLPFRWTQANGMEVLGNLPGIATDVSADGTVVVGSQQDGFPTPFRWRLDSGVSSLITHGSPAHDQAVAWGVSGDGNIAVGDSHITATRWGADNRPIGLPSASFGSIAVAASYDGSIVVGSMDSWTDRRRQAVRWSDPRELLWLGHLPGDTESGASDITSDGRVIVGSSGRFVPGAGYSSQGFLWTADEGMVGLPLIPAAISDDGRVMIGSTGVVGSSPIIWTAETGIVDLQQFLTGLGLDLTGWTLTGVTALSDDGTTIAGQGFPPRPTTSGAWIAVIPEPPALALGGIALTVAMLVMLLQCRRRLHFAGEPSGNRRTAMFKRQSFLLPVLLLTANILCATEPSFTILPELPGGGTVVSALSANGEFAIGQSGDPQTPFRWSRDTGIMAVRENSGAARDVSADGAVVVGWDYIIPNQAYRWSADGGGDRLQPLRAYGQSLAHGVSRDGRTVVGESESYAAFWGPDGFANVVPGVPGVSEAVAASWDGSIVAGTIENSRHETRGAFRWSADQGLILLGRFPGHDLSYAYDMTPDGRVIVGSSVSFSGGGRGYRWTRDEGMVGLDFIPTGLSDDGQVMIGVKNGNPVIWTAGTSVVELQPFLTGLGLDLAGWRLTSVEAISADGTTIVGHGRLPDLSMGGSWIATIPEPSTWLLCGTALAVIVLDTILRRRRR